MAEQKILTLEEAGQIMAAKNGNLGLFKSDFTALPTGLKVPGNLDLARSHISELPEGLTVGGWLDLSNTPITELSEGLTVGDWLNLGNTQITKLPPDLAVGSKIFRNDYITPAQARKVRRLKDGDSGDGSYIYADYIFTFVKEVRHIDGYALYVGKVPGKNVVSDGKFYAHCSDFRTGISDILFKRAKDRGAEQYRSIDRNTPIPLEDAKTMYRIITGACQQGTEDFVQSLEATGKLKDAYTVNEMLEVTKGQYGAKTFAKFFA